MHKEICRRIELAACEPEVGARLGAQDVTEAFRNGASGHAILGQTGCTTAPDMLEVHAREHAPLVGNAVTNLGLRVVRKLQPRRRSFGSSVACWESMIQGWVTLSRLCLVVVG